MPVIKHITAREILNAKGNPTIETTIVLDNELQATVSVPTGTSVSSFEAVDVKDNDSQRFLGQGVLKAVDNIKNIIAPALLGKDPTQQSELDAVMKELDATPNKSHLGANAILSVSLCLARVAALSEGMPLYRYIQGILHAEQFALSIPTPLFNLINGGKHAIGSFDFQEFIVIPQANTFSDNVQMVYTLRASLEKMLLLNNLSTLIGDEGGFSPNLTGNISALQFLKEAIQEANIQLGSDITFGIDAAATSFYKNNKYELQDHNAPLSAVELVDVYKSITEEFPIKYLEDPCSEDDWEGWQKAMSILSQNTLVVGDDLISTNPARLQMAIEKYTVNAVIIKPNQIGTLTETLDVVQKAKKAGLKIIVSHRSGETNDDFIADVAVGVGADYCKFGAPVRGERVAKYNRLLQIEKELSTR